MRGHQFTLWPCKSIFHTFISLQSNLPKSKAKISYTSVMLHITQLLNTELKSTNAVAFYINSLSPAENNLQGKYA